MGYNFSQVTLQLKAHLYMLTLHISLLDSLINLLSDIGEFWWNSLILLRLICQYFPWFLEWSSALVLLDLFMISPKFWIYSGYQYRVKFTYKCALKTSEGENGSSIRSYWVYFFCWLIDFLVSICTSIAFLIYSI